MKLDGQRVIVTGGAGFLGSHLADALASISTVVAVDDLSAGKLKNLAAARKAGATFVKRDLLRGDPVNVVRGAAMVFHYAANPDVRSGAADPRPTFASNVVMTHRVLDACRRGDVRGFCLASTSTVYGEATVVPTPEDYGPLLPKSVYGGSKLACEAMASAFAHAYGLTAVLVRYANVVGGRSGHGVVVDLCRKLARNPKSLEILGREPGTAKSYVYVDDAVRGTLAAVGAARPPADVFNVGSDDAITVREIADAIVREIGLARVAYRWTGGVGGGGWTGDVVRMVLATAKLRAAGWRPQLASAAAVAHAVRDWTRLHR